MSPTMFRRHLVAAVSADVTCPALRVMRGTLGVDDEGRILHPRHVLRTDGMCVHCRAHGVEGVRRD